MSSTSPEATPAASSDDSPMRHLESARGDAESFEAESPQARQAKAEALAHARAARAARAEYARLVSQQNGVPNPNPNNKMRAESLSDIVPAQGNSIVGAEMALIAARIVDQAHSSFLEVPAVKDWPPAAKAAVAGVAAWAPLTLLRPAKRRHGFGGFVTDPRVWTLGPSALLALAKGIVETNAQHKRPEEQKKVAEEQEKVPATPKKTAA
jgi:hypothetical protein